MKDPRQRDDADNDANAENRCILLESSKALRKVDSWSWMKKSQLELALRSAGKIARDSDFIVFGSQAILGVMSKPPKSCLVSQEVDIYPRTHPQALPLIVAKLGARSSAKKKKKR